MSRGFTKIYAQHEIDRAWVAKLAAHVQELLDEQPLFRRRLKQQEQTESKFASLRRKFDELSKPVVIRIKYDSLSQVVIGNDASLKQAVKGNGQRLKAGLAAKDAELKNAVRTCEKSLTQLVEYTRPTADTELRRHTQEAVGHLRTRSARLGLRARALAHPQRPTCTSKSSSSSSSSTSSRR